MKCERKKADLIFRTFDGKTSLENGAADEKKIALRAGPTKVTKSIWVEKVPHKMQQNYDTCRHVHPGTDHNRWPLTSKIIPLIFYNHIYKCELTEGDKFKDQGISNMTSFRSFRLACFFL